MVLTNQNAISNSNNLDDYNVKSSSLTKYFFPFTCTKDTYITDRLPCSKPMEYYFLKKSRSYCYEQKTKGKCPKQM